ncbi:MAG: hypothetical protein C0434_00995 [Xanthomonadaceae bacterium]|nr:hypothetical protein [Xanthomonadaceae bacterium]
MIIPRTRVLAGVLLAMAAVVVSAPVRAAEAATPAPPIYQAETCCSLCPKVYDRNAYVSEYMRGYRVLVEGKDGWLFRSEAELQWIEASDEEIWQQLRRLADSLKARGTQVVMFPQPPRGLVEANKLDAEDLKNFDIDLLQRRYSELVVKLRGLGFIVVDASVFSRHSGEPYFFKRDGHWSTSGAHQAAEVIAAQVKSSGFELPTVAYETKQVGVSGARGTLSFVVNNLCGLKYPMEFNPAYQTTAPASDDLFGDAEAPQAALIGTSFAATPNYHFYGFLRRALQADVLQAAFPGGGFDGSLSQFLASDLFQKSPPKVLIWEFPYQQLHRTDTAVMRRLLPLVNNGCTGKEPLLSGKANLKSGAQYAEVLVNGGKSFKAVPAKDVWLELQFSDSNIRSISAEIWYGNGKVQTINSEYNVYTKMNGRFVFETSYLPDTEIEPIVSVRVKSVTETSDKTTVTGTMCKRS